MRIGTSLLLLIVALPAGMAVHAQERPFTPAGPVAGGASSRGLARPGRRKDERMEGEADR